MGAKWVFGKRPRMKKKKYVSVTRAELEEGGECLETALGATGVNQPRLHYGGVNR